MAVKWTSEQQKVIDTRDKNILVSAAAGSGKTAVLVERILTMITDEKRPVDIDHLLVVTFTNAAAAEMRERIRSALEERSRLEPDNVHLQRQLVLVHNAKITTIHSFCLHVLRNHFQMVGIDPSFRIADEGEVHLIEQDVVKETVDAAYERLSNRAGEKRQADGAKETEAKPQAADKTAEQKEFEQFLEAFVPGKSDAAIEQMILQIYHFALGQPWPKQWLKQCCRMYETSWDSQENHPWMQHIIEDTQRLLEDAMDQLQEALRITQEPDGPYPYEKAILSDLELVEELQSGTDYTSYAGKFYEMKPFTRLGTKKDEAISEEKKLQVQNIRAEVKDTLAQIRKRYYYDREEILREEFEKSKATICVLAGLTEDFMDRLSEKKLQQNLLDFGDLEHLALNALVEQQGDAICPTAVAREYAENFEEIMIDEYQDSNLVQELILTSVSGKGEGRKNLFMVGDVKQSIYRFRLARPELFMEKYKTYQEAGESACRIDLHRNFRSRAEVLDGVNYLFRQIMTEQLGGIVYDRDAALYPGAEFAPCPNRERTPAPRLLLLEADGAQKQQEEAVLVGRNIRELVGREPVWDKELEAYRPARYGDIVILLRTISGWADTFGETLKDMGIPCFTGSQKGYFSATEIRVVLSYLQILDNPRQDIPLAAVLRSAIGGFADDELAVIRTASDHNLFYECAQDYRKNGTKEMIREKLGRFFLVYELLRAKSSHTPVHLLLWELLEVTGYGAYAQALPGGAQRKANLDMLVEKAIAYEATSYRGLYHFVRYIENLKKYEVDYGEANLGSEASDTVRIMSIHKSKGLEFPIVFVSGMGKQFNESDSRSKVVMHPEFGIACDYVDTQLRTRNATLLKRAIQQRTIAENLGEELRVLYVALTRAKERLILTGTTADAAARIEKWSRAANSRGETLSYSQISGASSYLDWVVPSLLRHPDALPLLETLGFQVKLQQAESGFGISLITSRENELEDLLEQSSQAVRLEELLQLDTQICYDEKTRDYLEQAAQSVYPYEKDNEIVGKLSVSELKKMSRIPEEEEGEELYRAEAVVPLIPAFRETGEMLTGAARGTAYHSLMENLDYSRTDELELQLEELISCGKMNREESEAIRLSDIRAFLARPIGQRIRCAALEGVLFREQPFVLGVPADQIREGWNPQETVLVQGIIDAYFLEEDELVILDYKTDKVSHPQILADRYRAQLDYYSMALQRLTGRKVRERLIYSFHLGEEVIL